VNDELDSELFPSGEFWTLDLPILENTVIFAPCALSITQNTNHEKAESETHIPKWLKKNAEWWSQGLLSNDEFKWYSVFDS